MYTFKECTTSLQSPNAKLNCENARKSVSCTTKINVYGKNVCDTLVAICRNVNDNFEVDVVPNCDLVLGDDVQVCCLQFPRANVKFLLADMFPPLCGKTSKFK